MYSSHPRNKYALHESCRFNPKIEIFKEEKNLQVTFNGLTFFILSFIDDSVQLPITQSVLLFDPSQMCSDLYAPFLSRLSLFSESLKIASLRKGFDAARRHIWHQSPDKKKPAVTWTGRRFLLQGPAAHQPNWAKAAGSSQQHHHRHHAPQQQRITDHHCKPLQAPPPPHCWSVKSFRGRIKRM